jgi:beta-alanine degradation protein BauB
MQISSVIKSLLIVLATATLLLGQVGTEKAGKQSEVKPEIVPITQEHHHHLVFENEYVRVFHVEVAPHSETKFHQHDLDYVFVTLGDSVVENDRVGEKPAKLELKDGQTIFVKGGFAHKAVNLSDKPFVNVTVELKKGYMTPPVANPVFVSNDELHTHGNVEIIPGQNQTPKMVLLVATTPLNLVRVTPETGADKSFKAGDVVWISVPDHYKLRAADGKDAKFTLLGFSAD